MELKPVVFFLNISFMFNLNITSSFKLQNDLTNKIELIDNGGSFSKMNVSNIVSIKVANLKSVFNNVKTKSTKTYYTWKQILWYIVKLHVLTLLALIMKFLMWNNFTKRYFIHFKNETYFLSTPCLLNAQKCERLSVEIHGLNF